MSNAHKTKLIAFADRRADKVLKYFDDYALRCTLIALKKTYELMERIKSHYNTNFNFTLKENINISIVR